MAENIIPAENSAHLFSADLPTASTQPMPVNMTSGKLAMMPKNGSSSLLPPSQLTFHFPSQNESSIGPAKMVVMNLTEEDNYDDGFGPEYSELLELERTKNNEKVTAADGGQQSTAWSAVFIGASLANIFLLFFLLIVTRGKRGYFGTRLYVLNLALFATIQIAVLVWTIPDDVFGLRHFFSFAIQDFMDKYNGSLLEATQIVYLSATTVLIIDSIQKYRNNGVGVGKMSWILALLFLDILPMIYIFVKGIRFEYIQIRPKPMAIYHVVVMVIFSLVSTLLGLTVICLPFFRCCRGKQEEIAISADAGRRHALRQKIFARRLMGGPAGGGPAPKPLAYSKLVCLFAFILATSWPQFTAFNLGVDLQPTGGMQQAKQISQEIQKPNGLISGAIKFMREARLVYWLMSIQKWAALFRPLFESLFAILLLLMPSIGSKFQMRKICPGEVGRSNNNDNNGMMNSSSVQEHISLNQIPSAPPISSVH